MNIEKSTRWMFIGGLVCALYVILGAFGAHGLESALNAKSMATYKTGVQYHFFHGIALILLGIIQQVIPTLNFEKVALSFTMGVMLFSFNCYLYSITNIKAFAMIVPIGGVFFLLGWALLTMKLYRSMK